MDQREYTIKFRSNEKNIEKKLVEVKDALIGLRTASVNSGTCEVNGTEIKIEKLKEKVQGK